MTLESLEKELNKLKYHIRMIADTLSSEHHPLESLVLSMDWDEDQLDRAHDIFERYDNKLKQSEPIEWKKLELDLCNEFNISYQTVKTIINAFYKNHQWVAVCQGYAKSFEPGVPIELQTVAWGK